MCATHVCYAYIGTHVCYAYWHTCMLCLLARMCGLIIGTHVCCAYWYVDWYADWQTTRHADWCVLIGRLIGTLISDWYADQQAEIGTVR